MSQEKVLKTLRNLGLTQLDSKVYIYLSKKGPTKGREISKALKLQKQQLYQSLKHLRSKAIVSATLEHPARFSAVPFEKVLDLFIRVKLKEAKSIQHDKTELLSNWEAIRVEETPDTYPKFMVIEGRTIIYSKIRQMINETNNRLSIISTVIDLARADKFGLLDTSFKNELQSHIQYRFLTHLSEQNIDLMKALLQETPKTELRFEIRNPNIGLKLFPRMVIKDEEEALFFISPKVDNSVPEQDNVCLWTNCKSLVHSFLAMFEDLWLNSTEIEKKIAEIETGKPTQKTLVINDAESVEKKYDEIMQSAKEQILWLTSSKGLIELSKNIILVKNWVKKGIPVKIMAPVVKENFDAAKQLAKFCAIRHVPIPYFETTIVDGKHLFQFKKPFQEREQFDPTFGFQNTFYTNDFEWVEIMKAALSDIWKNAQTPSTVTLESIIGPYGPPIVPLPKDMLLSKVDFTVIDYKPPGTITEKDVLNKIIHAKKIASKNPFTDPSKGYGSHALGVIHPPDQINLPDLMIQAWKHDKQSSFGEEDTIIVHLWFDTPTGHAYVPVAIAGDNPKGQNAWKAVYTSTPAEKNIQLFKKDQIQVRVYGNTLFAGWTKPIPLYPPNYSLPPACILFEGYGNVKTEALTIVYPSGFKIEIEQNYLDAFVTFIHTASKYSGPGTDGILARDHISINTPPK